MNEELILKPIIDLRKKINAKIEDIKNIEINFIRNEKISIKEKLEIKNIEINFIRNEKISIEEIEKLENEGIEIDINDIDIKPDGTLTYKNRRVLIYIRDVYKFLPKFHLCNCSTFQDMVFKGRKSRYVVSSRDDGNFVVNFMNNNFKNTKINRDGSIKLDVCLNCLKELDWDNISRKNSTERANIIKSFNLEDFFRIYPKDIINSEGLLSDKSAPLNTYTDSWKKISSLLRKKVNYRCQKCGKDFSESKHLLDVHHKNGQKNDNRDSNLIVLCRNCHSLEPMHNHLKAQNDDLPF